MEEVVKFLKLGVLVSPMSCRRSCGGSGQDLKRHMLDQESGTAPSQQDLEADVLSYWLI